MNSGIEIVGSSWRTRSSALEVERLSSALSIRSPPTTATRLPPATPPNMPVLDTSALAKAKAINPRKAKVSPRPILDLKKLRKKVSMAAKSVLSEMVSGHSATGRSAALYPCCDLAATGVEGFDPGAAVG